MKIEIVEFIDGARKAKGIAVIIDVFRAFSVGCYAYDSGAARLIATEKVEDAFLLKKKYGNCVLAGERRERKIEGFDFGNSPSEIIKADLKGKTVIHTTSAGTQGLINASNADMVITGSFVNASAVAGFIKFHNPEHVSLVAMGFRANESADEDLLCAEHIASLIRGEGPVAEERIRNLKETSGKRFFNPDNIEFSPPSDFFLCTMVDRFNFVLKATRRHDGNVDLAKVHI